MDKSLLPPSLQKGDTIGIFSPSSPGPIKYTRQYELGKIALSNLGYEIFEPSKSTIEIDYRSANPIDRAEILHKMFEDPKIKGIICSIGGYNTIEMLPFINYDLIKSNPKFICGYSDSSVLLNSLFYKTKLITFHGPMVIPSFGEYPKPFDFTTEHFQNMAQQSLQLPHKLTFPESWTDEFIEWTGPSWGTRSKKMFHNEGPIWLHKSAKSENGILVGGNTDSLLNIINTEYFDIPSNSILFIEDVSVSIERWAMMMWALKIRGVFKKINGLMIGKIEGMPTSNKIKMRQIILEILKEEQIDIPVVSELDIGHTSPILTLPIGSLVELDSSNEALFLRRI